MRPNSSHTAKLSAGIGPAGAGKLKVLFRYTFIDYNTSNKNISALSIMSHFARQ
jgi:hypothetical protein